MPTAVVDRPHSPVTDNRTHPVALAPRRAHTASPTRPVPTEALRPACASAQKLFLDPVLESEPSSSAPARTRRQHSALAAEATDVCASCPLLTACLYRAVVEYDVAGFVAGTTERQRAQIRARLGVEVEPEDFDTLAGVVGGQRTVDHDEVVRLRRAHPDESLERIARRLGCSLSTVKRHLRKERNQPSPAIGTRRPRPTEAQVRRAAGETLAENSGNRRAAA
ncbi:MAG TPA: WhiB family transcriptional regulator [Microlunatus sp.]|jgi:AraC-like DNA-binding protein|nr:WhiB family transcriptional regulator [Microlunatus sp.]